MGESSNSGLDCDFDHEDSILASVLCPEIGPVMTVLLFSRSAVSYERVAKSEMVAHRFVGRRRRLRCWLVVTAARTCHAWPITARRRRSGLGNKWTATGPSCVIEHTVAAGPQSYQEFAGKKTAETMTSSKSFFIETFLLGKRRHHHQHERHQQQQLGGPNNDTMLPLPMLHHQALQPLSHPVFSLYPHISGGLSTSSELIRGNNSEMVSCVATAASAVPTCLCPFCLPLTSLPMTGSPTDQRRQTSTASRPGHSSSSQHRGWQPWLPETPATEARLLRLTSNTAEIANCQQNHHQFTVPGLSRLFVIARYCQFD